MRTCRNRPRSMSLGGNMLSYPLSISLFQSRCIPLLPMFATLNFAHIISGLSGSIRVAASATPSL
jgi:hypothetical protein